MIYENVNGKRGSLLTQKAAYLPPGPVLIALRGMWPPAEDGTSIEVIANSFDEPGQGQASVRLFNLSPPTGTSASLTREGAKIADNVIYGDGSVWTTMAPTNAAFQIVDSSTGSSLDSKFQYTPPLGASSVFLIGLRDKSAPKSLQTQHVWLVDSPDGSS